MKSTITRRRTPVWTAPLVALGRTRDAHGLTAASLLGPSVESPSKRGLVGVALLLIAVLTAGCRQEPEGLSAGSNANPAPAEAKSPAFVGSKSCRDCHADFYRRWSASHHGLAMQPYTVGFAKESLTVEPRQAVKIGQRTYHVELEKTAGWMVEVGPNGERKFPLAHVMGGKNVYYFLTPLERGRLQVLPLAYDLRKKAWYDVAGSGVRHFPDRRDEALDWTDRMFTFNTTCFNCHVSQLATNYDLTTDTYQTTWTEPGISCESCHGPGAEHVRAMEQAPTGSKIEDVRIIRAKEFTAEQMNDLCATCHAKMAPISISFRPGDRFFDHFDLVTLESPDYYPDGRDLGENYTQTSWMMSSCVRSSRLACNHCHTSSGRMRYECEEANKSCLPCHAKEVNSPEEHGHHPAGSVGNQCVACHMPMTRFAAMGRSDHSMRPPTPATTIRFQSPNACNLCHTDRDAAWADTWVRNWYPRDYQAAVVRKAELIDAARKGQWKRLPEMLEELSKKDNDAVYKTSLVRLLQGCPDERKWPALVESLSDPSPLVRSSSVTSLAGHWTQETVAGLLRAAKDEARLVRIRGAAALAAVRPDVFPPADRKPLERAVEEFHTAMRARPDDWSSHANRGDFFAAGQDSAEAVKCFETAHRLEPRVVGPMVNAAIAYSNLNQADLAERSLRRALKAEPANAAANFNLGLLLGEAGRQDEAEQALRAALKADPQMATAAYNLGVLLATKNLDETLRWCRKAHDLRPDDAKYACTLAFYLRQKGDSKAAIEVLRGVLQRQPAAFDVSLLLADLFTSAGDRQAAERVYREASAQDGLSATQRAVLKAKLEVLATKP